MIHKRNINENVNIYYLLVFFFILSFIYYYWFGDYVLFVQEKQFLFIFSGEYLKEYFLKPGGFIEIIGDFLTRFYINPLAGAFILSASLIIPAIILFKINKRLFPKQLFSQILLLIPSCLLLLMQTHYYHKLAYNVGFGLILLYFLLSIAKFKNYICFIVLAFFPLFYYLTGFYAWIFLFMYIIYSIIYEKGKYRYIYLGFLVIIAGISFIIFRFFIFLQPDNLLLFSPLPIVKDPKHDIIFYLMTGYVIFYPLFGKIHLSNKIIDKYPGMIVRISIMLIFSISVFFLSKLYNAQTRVLLQLQKCVFEKKWNEAIKLHETFASRNLIGQHFYNIALSETSQLCDRLFFGRQDFGSRSLILPFGQEHLKRGAYFFYSIGLINEAHRWAYESMVVYGYYPQGIKMLVKTNLINGNYRMARKYINLLKKSFNYRKWAIDYEKLLNNPEKIKSHQELGEKLKIAPKEDFFIQIDSPQNNIPMLFNSNPNNLKAFEYEMSWLLLTKNVEGIIKNIGRIKEMGYKKIPRHIEEAILVYIDRTKKLPELYGFIISPEIQRQFEQYVSDFKRYYNNRLLLQKQMNQKYNNTFWYYYHFK
jgi:hypothetical protein